MSFFSVIIPTFNRASLLSSAIISVINQSYKDFELIIVDDGSHDNTRLIVDSFNDNRIKYLYQENGGVCVARNTGVFSSVGKYVTFLDSDDYAESDWLMNFYVELQSNFTDLVFCDMLLKYPDGRNRIRRARFRYDENIPNDNGMFMPGSFCIEAELLKKVGGFDTAIKFGEFTDLDFTLLNQKITRLFTNKIGVNYCPMPEGGAKNQTNKIQFIEHILKKHSLIFKADPETHLCYLQNAGVAAARTKQYVKARRFFLNAFFLKPIRLKNLLRYFIGFFPILSQRIWKL